MEHLLFTGAPAPIALSYLGSNDWDGGDFLSYPQRQGWDAALWGWGEDGTRLEMGHRSLDELAAFLQSWLFFGLLETVLGVKISRSEFTRQIDEKEGRRMVITTAKLKGYLEDWRLCMLALTANEMSRREDIIYDALSEAFLINRRLSRMIYMDDFYSGARLLQETLLCQTLLDTAIRRAAIDIVPTVDWAWQEGYNDQRLLEDRMQAAGWCPFTIRFLRLHLEPDAMAFVFSLGILRPRQDHGPCQERLDDVGDHCVADLVDAQALPRHVTTDCNCSLRGPSMSEIVELLQTGFVPNVAISMSEDDSEDVEILVSSERFNGDEREMRRYLAISHVWNDGLGNPDANTLPTCQIKRIGKLLLEFQGSWFEESLTSEHNQRPGYRVTVDFWMDTFCIPVEPQLENLRNGCIAQMRKIYSSAAAVLVLDPDLQQLHSDAKPIEIVGRLLSCSWRTRLWCYQEGTLAWDLCIPAQGVVFKLGEVLEHIPETWADEAELSDKNARDIVEFPVAQSLVAACRHAVRNPTASVKLRADDDDALRGMLRAIAHRTTTREGDETICIATFMDMNPAPILAEQPQNRMVKLLQNLPIISKNILFSRGPRLEVPGFRWAPQTFLSPHGLQIDIRFPLTYVPNASEPKERLNIPPPYLDPEGHGLAAFFSGIKLDGILPNPLPKHFVIMTSEEHGFVVDTGLDGGPPAEAEICQDSSVVWAIIFANEEKVDRVQEALLVEWLGKTETGLPLCRRKYELSVQVLANAILEGTRKEMLQQHRYSGTQIPFQWWVID